MGANRLLHPAPLAPPSAHASVPIPAPALAPVHRGWTRSSGSRTDQRGVKVVPAGRQIWSAFAGPARRGRSSSAVALVLGKNSRDRGVDTEAWSAGRPRTRWRYCRGRLGGRYEVLAHPWLHDVLRRQTLRGATRFGKPGPSGSDRRPCWSGRILSAMPSVPVRGCGPPLLPSAQSSMSKSARLPTGTSGLE
jgi:hypothetical protein